MTVQTSDSPVLSARGLRKTFRIGFWRKQVPAVRDSTFDVRRGEIFGIVGPNGAGKTTTIKMLLGLITPDGGEAEIMGVPIHSRLARRRVSFLPETPNFYDYLKPEELLDYFGDLYDMDRREKKRRIPELLELVGLAHAKEKQLRKFSKGMLQRIGLAQALLPDADLVILDEPQSGLDPLGRKDVRDIIISQRDRGKTVVLCSHILPDVEQVCDRVAIITQGRVRKVGRLDELVALDTGEVEVSLRAHATAAATLTAAAQRARENVDGTWTFSINRAEVDDFLAAALASDARIVSVQPRRQDLEDVFVAQATAAPDPSGAHRASPTPDGEEAAP